MEKRVSPQFPNPLNGPDLGILVEFPLNQISVDPRRGMSPTLRSMPALNGLRKDLLK